MRTRCPVCSTIFRVTSEQLRLKAGKVRCGHCQAVFNAFDEFLTEETVVHEVIEASSTPDLLVVPPLAPVSIIHSAPVTEALIELPVAEVPPVVADPLAEQIVPFVEAESEPEPETAPERISAPVISAPAEIEELAQIEPELEPKPELVSVKLLETPEESAMAAREAGLMAARELTDAPGYNRWAAGALAGQGQDRFDHDQPRRAVWPFVVFSLLLAIVLLGQLLFYFRTELAQRYPSVARLYDWAEVAVPLPRNAELVAIETSDLQSDNARGLFVLQATLHNRAGYAQAWPALELTLTDTSDTVVSRRVLTATEYLPPATDPTSFPANGETPVKLWIEAKDIGAAGYRLYLFYP